MPWVVFAIFWHLTWEIVLEPELVKRKAVAFFGKWGRMSWVAVFLVGGLISVGFWFSANRAVAELQARGAVKHEDEESHKKEEPPPAPIGDNPKEPAPEAKPTLPISKAKTHHIPENPLELVFFNSLTGIG